MNDMATDINELLTRSVEKVFPSRDEAEKILTAGKPLRVYWGIDPTGSELHVGHTVALFFLKRLMALGHKAIFLIGDFTARIGDPTDKEATRKQLTPEETKANMATYLEQVGSILPLDQVEVRYNSEWWEGMSIQKFEEIKSAVTVQQLLARDMFQKRMTEGKPISAQELDYPLLQGYDTVALDADGEVGGNDQTFNMLVGRDLLKRFKQREKIVFTLKLLVDPATGKKMSKTEGTLVALTATPENMFGGIMAFSDGMIESAFEMVTEVSSERREEIKNRLAQGENPKNLKMELAHEIVRQYHGAKAADTAQEEFTRVFSKGGVPEHMPEGVAGDDVAGTMAMHFGISNSEAHRKIREGAVSVNGKTVTDPKENAKPGDILRAGRKFLKIV